MKTTLMNPQRRHRAHHRDKQNRLGGYPQPLKPPANHLRRRAQGSTAATARSFVMTIRQCLPPCGSVPL